MNKNVQFIDLPIEILNEIETKLSPKSIARLSQTSKLLNETTKNIKIFNVDPNKYNNNFLINCIKNNNIKQIKFWIKHTNIIINYSIFKTIIENDNGSLIHPSRFSGQSTQGLIALFFAQ
jgi:hypothetical protein